MTRTNFTLLGLRCIIQIKLFDKRRVVTFKGAVCSSCGSLGTLHATCIKACSLHFKGRIHQIVFQMMHMSPGLMWKWEMQLKDYTGAVAQQGRGDQRDGPLSPSQPFVQKRRRKASVIFLLCQMTVSVVFCILFCCQSGKSRSEHSSFRCPSPFIPLLIIFMLTFIAKCNLRHQVSYRWKCNDTARSTCYIFALHETAAAL